MKNKPPYRPLRSASEVQQILEWAFARGVQYIRFEDGLVFDRGHQPTSSPALAPAPQASSKPKAVEPARKPELADPEEYCPKCNDLLVVSRSNGGTYCFKCWVKNKRNR